MCAAAISMTNSSTIRLVPMFLHYCFVAVVAVLLTASKNPTLGLSTVGTKSILRHPSRGGSVSSSSVVVVLAANDKDESWDSDVDYDKEFPQEGDNMSPDPSVGWNVPLPSVDSPKLGIDIGRQLNPLSEKDANELRAAATELINERVAEGLDDIARMRSKMKQEVEKQRRTMDLASDFNTQRESAKLLSKIDRISGDFLDSSRASRESTKMAAAADRNMVNKGVDMGVWGILDNGASVATADGTGKYSLLGSVEAAMMVEQPSSSTTKQETNEETTRENPVKNRLLIVADPSQDPTAKQLLPVFTKQLEKAIPGVQIRLLKPTDKTPVGGDNAACVIVFCTSLSERSSLNAILDKVLRRTMQAGGEMGDPPTQLVAVSTLGTERYEKFPYTMQNLMGGGKLEKRRQMEESIMGLVKKRMVEPPLDYTVVKFGDIKAAATDNNNFSLLPGDVLDGTTPVETASQVLLQAVAYQPSARNATLCAIGTLPQDRNIWDEAFLRLAGPELNRWTELGMPDDNDVFGQLKEYIMAWGTTVEEGKGLTTPVRWFPIPETSEQQLNLEGVILRTGIQLLFLPTATGKNYLSRAEEADLGDNAAKSQKQKLSRQKVGKDGGVEVVVEITKDNQLRVRAKRCNYGDDTPVKEISETTILERLEKAMQVWQKEHMQ